MCPKRRKRRKKNYADIKCAFFRAICERKSLTWFIKSN